MSGGDLAPDLIGRLVSWYRQDYPELELRLLGGGTRQALEDLINRRADVAFLSRPVTADEQRLFLSVTGDSALCFPVALGGLTLLTTGDGPESLHVSDLRNLLSGGPGPRPRLYAPDPNSGLWAALALRLDLPEPAGPIDRVTFLEDERAVMAAVRADRGTVGLVSSLDLEEDSTGTGTRLVRIAPDSAGATAAEPTYEKIAAGRYPLFHYLYVACRPGGGIEGDKFVTHLTSARGQRQVERSGYLPSRQVPREIILLTDPVGGGENKSR